MQFPKNIKQLTGSRAMKPIETCHILHIYPLIVLTGSRAMKHALQGVGQRSSLKRDFVEKKKRKS
ncbi:MAG: hypothetical protein DRR16_12225 [Candidatus Parabeggiatoa sp. nov. 3]|nr:MAG: hypothetical protein DRR00_18125 [Gammaproteobacteria bacterium]RKZ59768.1 MAG: hypothetical protein DRQ99_23175 [Gammaproteobacteria bacterium]RKZ85328.1 MAG: hypothetical protein DRR16_12225 [Gammaproteobacteria bacterium]